MQLPGFLKKSFAVATAAMGIGLSGCAVVPYDNGVYLPPPVVVAPVVSVYPAPVIVVPGRPYHHAPGPYRYDRHPDYRHGWNR